jgi:methyl-accepting chemotaxis protein
MGLGSFSTVGYKRNIYLINPRFQLKFSFYICGLVFLSSLIYPVTIYDIATSLAKKSPEIAQLLETKQIPLIAVLALWQLGFAALVFVICIFFSHKIAGPIYKLQKFLIDFREGENDGKLFFRDGDYFQEIAEDVNLVVENLRDTYQKDFVYLSEVEAYMKTLEAVVPEDKKIVVQEISQKLSEIQNRFQA